MLFIVRKNKRLCSWWNGALTAVMGAEPGEKVSSLPLVLLLIAPLLDTNQLWDGKPAPLR